MTDDGMVYNEFGDYKYPNEYEEQWIADDSSHRGIASSIFTNTKTEVSLTQEFNKYINEREPNRTVTGINDIHTAHDEKNLLVVIYYTYEEDADGGNK